MEQVPRSNGKARRARTSKEAEARTLCRAVGTRPRAAARRVAGCRSEQEQPKSNEIELPGLPQDNNNQLEDVSIKKAGSRSQRDELTDRKGPVTDLVFKLPDGEVVLVVRRLQSVVGLLQRRTVFRGLGSRK